MKVDRASNHQYSDPSWQAVKVDLGLLAFIRPTIIVSFQFEMQVELSFVHSIDLRLVHKITFCHIVKRGFVSVPNFRL